MKKRGISFILTLLMCAALGAPPAFAIRVGDVSGVPNDYWQVFGAYEDALKSNDAAKIAQTGEKVIEYWLGGAPASRRSAEWIADAPAHGYEINALWSVSQTVGEQYEKLGDTANALRMYEVSLAFVDAYKALLPDYIPGDPGGMEFSRLGLQNKIAASGAAVEVFAEVQGSGGDTSFHNAKFEPPAGAYIGESSGGGISAGGRNPGSTLIFVIYENEDMETRVENDLIYNEKTHGWTRDGYSAVEIAWNFAGEGSALSGVPGDTAKVTAAARYLKELGIPVLLRVGAEMNVWRSAADPEEFKTAFRFIADIMHTNAPNVATVWSPNAISAQGLNYDMFYPGDSYVDWVGISLYVTRYMLGNPGTDNMTAAIYGTGAYANPILKLKPLVDGYGARKPIMISEGGVSLHNNTNGEDLTQWALPRIRQMYACVPMIYPQVKAIYWFNVDRRSSEAVRFDFGASPAAKELYTELTSDDYYLSGGGKSSPVTYKKLGTATLPANAVTLRVYAPVFGTDDITAVYKVDGQEKGRSAIIPYSGALNLSDLADGSHTLTVEIISGGKTVNTAVYNMRKGGGNVTLSKDDIPDAAAPDTAAAITAKPTWQSVYVDGGEVPFDAYSIGGSNYFKLRDLAYVLSGTGKQFDIGYDAATKAITMESGKSYTPSGGELTRGDGSAKPASPTASMIYLDGKELELTVYNIGGSNYFKLRDIGIAHDFGVEYIAESGAIEIDTTVPYTPE